MRAFAIESFGEAGSVHELPEATDKLQRLAGLVEGGTLRPPEIHTFPLERADQALAEMAGRHVRGKLVVLP